MMALVTGEVGCGKTTVCQRALGLLRVQGVTPSGILSPPRRDARGVKIGIDALDVATGERRCLAEHVPGGGETIGYYTFYQDTLTWAVARLQAAVRTPWRVQDRKLLVVDEIGPLELMRGGGFVTLLEPLADPSRVPHALVVVRLAYVDALARLLDRPDVRRFRLDAARRDGLPAQIAAALRSWK